MSEGTFTNTFRVGKRKCTMSFSQESGLHAVWQPNLPGRGELSKKEMAEYRAGRDALIAEVGKALGGSILIVET